MELKENQMYELTWTVRARAVWEELSEELQDHAQRVVDQINKDPLNQNTYELLGDPAVQHLVTTARLYVAYIVIGSLIVILDLKVFATFLLD